MKRLVIVLAVVGVLLAGTTSAFAGFINGGFEAGDYSGWTKNGGSYYGSYNYTGDPGKSAIVSAGTDPYTGNNLNMVFSGNYSARVNNYDWNYHFSTIEQTVTWNDPNIYFAWAAVIEDPGHPYPGHMRITLDNLTDIINLYDIYIDYYTHPAGVTWSTYGGWGYTDWNIVNLDTSAYLGDSLRLRLLASDCAWGGHGGYAYLDGFGAKPPTPGVVPEPASLSLMGLGLLGLLRKKR